MNIENTPEFVVLPLAGGNGRYLDGLARSAGRPA
jgi:hypothetical protein